MLTGVAQTHAQHHSSARELIDAQHLTCELPGTSTTDRRHHGAQSDPSRPDSNRSQGHPRVAGRRRWITLKADVVLEEHSVPTGVLGEDGQLQDEGWVTALATGG